MYCTPFPWGRGKGEADAQECVGTPLTRPTLKVVKLPDGTSKVPDKTRNLSHPQKLSVAVVMVSGLLMQETIIYSASSIDDRIRLYPAVGKVLAPSACLIMATMPKLYRVKYRDEFVCATMFSWIKQLSEAAYQLWPGA